MVTMETEEDVKVKSLLPLLEDKGYDVASCDFEESIEVHEGRRVKHIYADVIVYADDSKQSPLILCETKAPTEVLDRKVREQAISYARLLPQIAPYTLITNGSQVQVFHTLNKERVAEIPSRDELDSHDSAIPPSMRETLRTEAKHELFIIDDVQSFKNVLRSCHNDIRNNEGMDPTEAFDEMSKLLFCKMYEEKHTGENRFRLSVYDDTLERLNVNVVREIFEETQNDERFADLFPEDTSINLSDRTIRKIVGRFEDYDLSLTAFDVKGEAFEYFLGDTFTGGLGEYFTPRNIVEFMVEAVDPKIGEKIVDPFCGTGGFLIYAFDVVSEKIRLQKFSEEEKENWQQELSNRSLYGTDWKERTSQACKMNMVVHGDGSAGVYKHDGLTDVEGDIESDTFDICLTNPPFGSYESDEEVLEQYELGSGRNSQSREILALERSLELVKPGGQVAIVIIDGVLNNDSTQYVRDYIKEHAWIKGIISLNSETFEGYGARAKTSILLLERKESPDSGQQEDTFMAIAENTGYAPNGDTIPGNELPDILLAYQSFLEGEDEDELPDIDRVWTESVEDRLDAEYYYRPGHEPGTVNVDEIEKGFGTTLRDIKAEYDALVEEIETAFSDVEYEEYKLDELLVEVSNREKVNEDELYTLLGVRWWGGGAFKREEEYGRDMSTKTKYRVESPWIIYNRMFAYRGAFAVLEEEHDDYHVSVEFPTFDVKESVDHPELIRRFVVQCMNTPQYLNRIDSHSTGSTQTSRNRFHADDFLSLSIKVPKKKESLREIVKLLERATTLKFEQERLEEEADELLDNVGRLLPGPSSSPVAEDEDTTRRNNQDDNKDSDDQVDLNSF